MPAENQLAAKGETDKPGVRDQQRLFGKAVDHLAGMSAFARRARSDAKVPGQSQSQMPERGEEDLGSGFVLSRAAQARLLLECMRSFDPRAIDGEDQPAANPPMNPGLLLHHPLEASLQGGDDGRPLTHQAVSKTGVRSPQLPMAMEFATELASLLPPDSEVLPFAPGHEQGDPGQSLGRPEGVVADGQVGKKPLGRNACIASCNC